MSIFAEISEGSLILVIDAIISKLKIDIKNDKKLKLIGAIKQLSVNPNANGESLTKEYLTMMSNEDKLQREVSRRTSRMQRLQGIHIPVPWKSKVNITYMPTNIGFSN